MIAKTHISGTLAQIDTLYSKSTKPRDHLFYSKLAVLELCGWIEESMDDIVRKCGNRCLRNPATRKFLEEDVIEPNFGFGYSTHFSKMLRQVLGLVNLERLERRLDPVKFARLRSTLGLLKVRRDAEAHTHLKGIKLLDAPAVTKVNFQIVYDGLKDIEDALRTLRV